MNLAACVFLIDIIVEIWFILHVKQIRIKGKMIFYRRSCYAVCYFDSADRELQMIEIVRTYFCWQLFCYHGCSQRFDRSRCTEAFFTIPGRADEVLISEGQMNKVQVVSCTKQCGFKLIFPRFKLKELVFELQKHVDKVSLQKSLQNKYNTIPCVEEYR